MTAVKNVFSLDFVFHSSSEIPTVTNFRILLLKFLEKVSFTENMVILQLVWKNIIQIFFGYNRQ